MSIDLKKKIRTIVDFPVKGVRFRDVTTLMKDADGLSAAIDQMVDSVGDLEFDIVAGPESRGFIFGVPVAVKLHKGFVPVRKPGKLPGEVYSQEYSLEYGTSKLEIHTDAIKPGQRVLIVDDLLATGGTAAAIAKLIEKAGGVVAGFVFVIDLVDLKGREALAGYPVRALVEFTEDEIG